MKEYLGEYGVALKAETPTEHIQAIRIYRDGSHINLQIDLGPCYKDTIDQLLQYLTPMEAMGLATGIARIVQQMLDEEDTA